MEQEFEALPDIPMDKSFTLDQLTGRFQSVRDGAPELPKNSKDHYSRLGVVDREDRQIVVLVSPDSQSLGVLDFGGATELEFEGWKTWSSREAGRQELAPDIEAGHGNGGKSFMVRGSLRQAYMCGYADGKLTKMGFRNDDPDLLYHPGWYRTHRGDLIRSLPAGNVEDELNRELADFGVSATDLPADAKRILKARKAFTIVHVDGVRDWVTSRNRDSLVGRLPFDLIRHPQMALTIESCKVWVMRGKVPLYDGPLAIGSLDPFPGFETPVRTQVPNVLVDPRSKEKVSTGAGEKFLEIRTSRKSLRFGENRPLNVVRVRNDRNVVANWVLSELVDGVTAGFLYGTLQVPSLTGLHLAGAERQNLSDTSLVRSLQAWTEKELGVIAEAIRKAQMTEEAEEDLDATNQALRRMRDLMRQFLTPEGPDGGAPREYGSIVQEIVLEQGRSELKIPVGTVVPLVFKCYEKDQDKRLPVLKPRVHIVATPRGVVEFNGFSSIKATAPGKCLIHLENLEGTVSSNEITIQAFAVEKAAIGGPSEPVKQGETLQLDIEATNLENENVEGAVWDLHVDEPDLARVSRTGVFTAGQTKGTVTVQLRFGPKSHQISTAKIEIGSERVERRPPPGSDIPHLLLCGTPAPGKEDVPEPQRTHPPGLQYPTIIDFDPLWDNIVWINLHSPEAMKVRQSRPGTGAAAGIVTYTVHQFLALKSFEVLKRLKVRQVFEDEARTSLEFLTAMSQIEMDTAGFLDAAYGLVDRMLKEQDGAVLKIRK